MTTQIGDQEPGRPVGLGIRQWLGPWLGTYRVIQALEEIGVHPQVVAGTSIGALVGGVCGWCS